jgi:hypothetical protein
MFRQIIAIFRGVEVPWKLLRQDLYYGCVWITIRPVGLVVGRCSQAWLHLPTTPNSTTVMWPTARSWIIFKRTLPQTSRSSVTYIVPVAVNCSYCAPDDGYGMYPKHVKWCCNKIRVLVSHFLDISCVYILYYNIFFLIITMLKNNFSYFNCFRRSVLSFIAAVSILHWTHFYTDILKTKLLYEALSWFRAQR